MRNMRLEANGGGASSGAGMHEWMVATAVRADLASWDEGFGLALQGEELLRQLLTPEGVRVRGFAPLQSVRLRVVLPASDTAAQRVGPSIEMIPGTAVDLNTLHQMVPEVLAEGPSSIEIFLQNRYSHLGCDDSFMGVCVARPADLACQPSAGLLGAWGATIVPPTCAGEPEACEAAGHALSLSGLERGTLMGELQLPETRCPAPGCAFRATLAVCRTRGAGGRCTSRQTFASAWSRRAVSSPLPEPERGATRLELRFDGGSSPVELRPWDDLGSELAGLLGVEVSRVAVRESHALRDSTLSFAVFDLLARPSGPSSASLAARLAALLGDMRCDSLLEPRKELWTTDECLAVV